MKGDEVTTEVPEKRSETIFEMIKKRSHGLVTKNVSAHMSLTDKTDLMSNPSRILETPKIRKKPIKWSDQDTKTFFKCLEIFGMDFSMIREILCEKTQRQILRKFHKEKKRNPEFVEKCLKTHEHNLISRKFRTHSLMEGVLNSQSLTDQLSENVSVDSLDLEVNKKLKLMIEAKNENEEDPVDRIMPLEYYLDNNNDFN